jgi:hypothetical protein
LSKHCPGILRLAIQDVDRDRGEAMDQDDTNAADDELEAEEMEELNALNAKHRKKIDRKQTQLEAGLRARAKQYATS